MVMHRRRASRTRAHAAFSVLALSGGPWRLTRWRLWRPRQLVEAVQVCCRIEVKLDPVPSGRITPDGGISTEAVPDPSHPAGVIRRSITPGASRWAISRLAVNKAGLSP